jgi:hypothetical protein
LGRWDDPDAQTALKPLASPCSGSLFSCSMQPAGIGKHKKAKTCSFQPPFSCWRLGALVRCFVQASLSASSQSHVARSSCGNCMCGDVRACGMETWDANQRASGAPHPISGWFWLVLAGCLTFPRDCRRRGSLTTSLAFRPGLRSRKRGWKSVGYALTLAQAGFLPPTGEASSL